MRTIMNATAAVVLTLPSVARAVEINVPGDHPTIQAGIDAAVDGDVVIVSPGEYFERIDFDGKAIVVRSTAPTDAGVVLNTIINGGALGSVVTCISGEGPGTKLSGFVITGGNATFGGGMYVFDSDPTVANCTFSGNTATVGGGMAGYFSTVTVTHCTFSGNAASAGGGMLSSGSNLTVTGCTFIGNTASVTWGGAMSNFACNLTVADCLFSGNASIESGGGMRSQNCNMSVINCSFSGNTVDSGLGGGMQNVGTTPTLVNTGFCDNTPDQIAGSVNDGGGNSLLHCPPPLRSCPADVDASGDVGIVDLLAVLGAWGSCY